MFLSFVLLLYIFSAIHKIPTRVRVTHFAQSREIWDFSEGDWGLRRRFLRGRNILYFHQKLARLTLLKADFLFCFLLPHSYYATVQWNCHCIKGNNPWPSHIHVGYVFCKGCKHWVHKKCIGLKYLTEDPDYRCTNAREQHTP